jgi:hypothetical protein
VKSQVFDQGLLRIGVVAVASDDPKKRVRRMQPGRVEQSTDGAIDMDFSPEELREFVSADHFETRADPAFKESLRKKLWTLVSDRNGSGSSSTE